jgi:hypothetical protein
MAADELHDRIARRKIGTALTQTWLNPEAEVKPKMGYRPRNPTGKAYIFCCTTLYKYSDWKCWRSSVEPLYIWKDDRACGDLGMRHDTGQLISHIPSAAKPCKPEVLRPKRR